MDNICFNICNATFKAGRAACTAWGNTLSKNAQETYNVWQPESQIPYKQLQLS